MSYIYGIQNLGNTCYINVNIQMILNCKEINDLLVEKKDIVDPSELLFSYICILKRLYEIRKEEQLELEDENNDTIYTRKLRLTSFIEKFRKIFSQVSFNQQDCLEGLTFILNNFHKTLCKYDKHTENQYKIILDNVRYNDEIKDLCISTFKHDIVKDYSLFFNLFYSYYLNTIKCNKCNHKVNRLEQYKEISLNISNNPLENNIEKLLDTYFSEELLEGYKCDECKETECYKNLCLLNTPKYLIIQLKRFTFNLTDMKFSKILKEVNYPLFLDMDKYCLNNNTNSNINSKNIYELTNIINHLGISLNSGHYTSHHKILDKWFYADDCSIDKVNQNEIFKRNNKILSYVLIYEKQTKLEE